MTVLLAPTAAAPATKLAGRTFRKQVLKAGGLDYRTPDGQTRRLEFDAEYFNDLSKAFRERAYDSVKAIVADAKNAHTMDPERVRGTVVDLLPSEDGSGLDAVMTLSEDTARLVDEHPDMGVSARIVEGLQRGDGRSWPRAIQHVLLTTDPRVTGLSPWKAVDLANEDGHAVVDLSAATPTSGRSGAVDLSDADIERIAEALHQRFAQEEPASGDGAGPYEDSQGAGGDLFADEISDADLEAFLQTSQDTGASYGDSAYDDAYAEAELSTPAGDPAMVELSSQNAALAEQVSQMNAELASARWEREREALLNSGVPPAMLDLAAPMLQAEHQGAVVDLSTPTGATVSPSAVVRSLLRQAAGIVDLSQEQGHGAPATASADINQALNAAWNQQFGGK